LLQLENEYNEAEGENREEVLEALKAYHTEVLGDPEANREFELEVLDKCGGIYTPYVFWLAVRGFLYNEVDKAFLFRVADAFANSNFEEEEQKKMKPLLMIYFAQEREFEMDRLWAQVVSKAHPSVKAYFEKVLRFVQQGSPMVKAFQEKFELLKDYYPDFHLLNLPVSQLREELGEEEVEPE